MGCVINSSSEQLRLFKIPTIIERPIEESCRFVLPRAHQTTPPRCQDNAAILPSPLISSIAAKRQSRAVLLLPRCAKLHLNHESWEMVNPLRSAALSNTFPRTAEHENRLDRIGSAYAIAATARRHRNLLRPFRPIPASSAACSTIPFSITSRRKKSFH
jgi:hypothetical protein